MPRPVTLFTGQWADLPLEDLAAKARRLGLRRPRAGLLGRSLRGRQGARGRRLLPRTAGDPGAQPPERASRSARTSSARPSATGSTSATGRSCPPEICGDGDPEGVRTRAAERMKDTARAAARLGVRQVNGFTGSSIWHLLYSFPPNDYAELERGYEEFAERWSPILDVFDQEGVKFGLEVHPTEIAFDFVTDAEDAGRDRQPRGVRVQLRPEPLRPPARGHGAVRARLRRPDLPRARQGLEEAARRTPFDPRLAPELRRGGARLGLPSRPATATSTSRTSSAR